MRIHLVGGFLGSGKTTAIVGAARLLQNTGISVGVVTNDQGRSLVDTEFVRSGGIAATEVTGGCFCCHFPDLQKMIEQLDKLAGPSVVFAEPVGSCADLVATVLKPLTASKSWGREIGRLSVFTDIRLLRQRLWGRALPFSDDVQYIFDSQIEEAEILVLNKSDLLPAEASQEVAQKATVRHPGKTIVLQSSLAPGDLQRWIDTLNDGGAGAQHAAVPIDYDRYAHGEMGLAWYDAALAIDLAGDTAREVALGLIDELRDVVHRRGRPVGHLKVHVRHAAGSFKASITEDTGAPADADKVAGRHLDVTINARAEDEASGLQRAIREGVDRALSRSGITWKLSNEEAFHPSRPQPYVRMP